MFDMTGATREYVDMDIDFDGVEYTGPTTLLEYVVGEMMLKNMGNASDSTYAGNYNVVIFKHLLARTLSRSILTNYSQGMKVSLLLSRRWFYHAVSVFLQSVLLLVVAYTTFYYRVDNFQDRMMVTITCMSADGLSSSQLN